MTLRSGSIKTGNRPAVWVGPVEIRPGVMLTTVERPDEGRDQFGGGCYECYECFDCDTPAGCNFCGYPDHHPLTAAKTASAGEKVRGTQLRRRWRPGVRRWWKRQSSRRMRRWAKLDPEGAPRRGVLRGWAD